MKSFVVTDRWAGPRFVGAIWSSRTRSICMGYQPNDMLLGMNYIREQLTVSVARGTTVLKIYGIQVDPRTSV